MPILRNTKHLFKFLIKVFSNFVTYISNSGCFIKFSNKKSI
nr:MAG TPA: hypothetical protein [Bacteriophage sp.]